MIDGSGNMMRSSWIALLMAVVLAGCSRPTAGGGAAASRPAPIGDFAAFGGGGPMDNLAPAIAAPPMKPRWTFSASAGFNAAPAIAGDAVYVADSSGGLTALDLASGSKRWIFRAAGGFDATPLVEEGVVYIGDMAGSFHAVEAATGRQLWSANALSPIHAGANGDGKHLLFGTDAGLILCLDLTGKKVWTAQADGRINAPPAIRDGVALFTSCDAHLRALRIGDGRELFKTDLGNLAPGSACISNNLVYVGTDQGHVLALALASGAIQWHFDAIADGAMVFASPALAEQTLVIAARDNSVYALNAADGNQKWAFATGAGIDASPVISDGRVYVASKDRRLYVLNLADGKSLWTFETARPVMAPVAIGRGVLVMGDAGGTVYCLEPQ